MTQYLPRAEFASYVTRNFRRTRGAALRMARCWWLWRRPVTRGKILADRYEVEALIGTWRHQCGVSGAASAVEENCGDQDAEGAIW